MPTFIQNGVQNENKNRHPCTIALVFCLFGVFLFHHVSEFYAAFSTLLIYKLTADNSARDNSRDQELQYFCVEKFYK